MKILNRGNRLAHQLLHRGGVGFDACFADVKDVLFDVIEQFVDLAFMLVHARDHAGAGLDHFAKQELFADDLDVIIEVGGGRDRVGQ